MVASSVHVAPPRLAAETHITPGPPFATGVPPLDQLLGGGYTAGTATLLYGPPFGGKQVLQQLAFVDAASRGIPCTFLLHGMGAEPMSRRLRTMDARFARAEAAGHITYIDAHSRVIGDTSGHSRVIDVQDPHDLSRMLEAIDSPRLRAREGKASLLAIQSASTLLTDLGAARGMQFLQTLVARTLRDGGVALVALQSAMHSDADIRLVRELCSYTIELRKRAGAHVLRAERALAPATEAEWSEYLFTPTSLRVPGARPMVALR